MSAVLTLAIPTFNAHPSFVDDALASIAGQVEAAAGAVEVVVVDNGSDEPSAAHLRDCAGRYPGFRFVRHEVNLGYDRNVLRVLDDVSTDYTWFFGDDDLMQEDALGAMLQAIAATPGVGLLITHASFFTEESEVAGVSRAVTGDFEVRSGLDFVEHSGWTAAALSTFCVATEQLRRLDLDFALGSNWVHFAAFALLTSSETPHVLFPEAFVAVRRSHSARWFSNFGNQYRSGLGLITVIRAGVPMGVDPRVYEFYRTQRLATNHMDLLTLAWPLTAAARREIHAESRSHFSGSARFRLLDVPILFSPNWAKSFASASIRAAGRVRRALVGRNGIRR